MNLGSGKKAEAGSCELSRGGQRFSCPSQPHCSTSMYQAPTRTRHSAATGQTQMERYSSDLGGLFSRLREACFLKGSRLGNEGAFSREPTPNDLLVLENQGWVITSTCSLEIWPPLVFSPSLHVSSLDSYSQLPPIPSHMGTT